MAQLPCVILNLSLVKGLRTTAEVLNTIPSRIQTMENAIKLYL